MNWILPINAVYTVENALAKVKDEKGMKRVEKFLKEEICPECGGSRLSEKARAPRLKGIGLDEACRKKCVLWQRISVNPSRQQTED